jgi:hypothetical protein
MPSKSRGARPQTTTQRGYGHDHQENRQRLLGRHVDGRACWWCGRPMYRDKTRNWDGHPLEAHHTKSLARHGRTSRNRADALLHKTCNIQCGDGTHDDQRPTNQQRVDTTQLDDGLGALAMGWPWT